MHVSVLVAAALDPVMTASVFAAGQTGLDPDETLDSVDVWSQQSGGVLWCSAYDELQRQCPWLPQAGGQDRDRDYACVDLTVEITDGRIVEVNLEGVSLTETFAALGQQDEAEAVDGLLGGPADEVGPALAALVAILLQGPPSGTSSAAAS